MKINYILIVSLISLIHYLSISSDDIKGGILDKNVNSNDEDYASYVIYGTTTDTLFFTSSRPIPNRRPIALPAEMFYSTRQSSLRFTPGKKINEGWSPAQRIPTDASLIAEFTRGSQTLSSDRIIFAAERDLSTATARGTSYFFDLWEMLRTADGFTLPQPITEINERDAWDSQPALSPDGKILFFVSDRAGGIGGLDIWYSVRDATGRWQKPKLVPNINTPSDELSPHCGVDGKFYYASNWDYEKNEIGKTGRDIYRADYKDIGGISLPINPLRLDEAFAKDAKIYGVRIPTDIRYNSDSDDEFPFITPDRAFIFLTSNRKAEFGKRNIFAFSMPKSRILLQVNVKERVLDEHGNEIQSPTTKIGLPMSLVDTKTNIIKEITSGEPYEVDADKDYQVRFTKFVEEECYQNKIEGPNELRISIKKPFGYDTTYNVDALITRQKLEINPIVFYSTEKIPYFVTGYWYPNTSDNLQEFRKRESSGFFDQTGFIDSTGYNYESISKIIDQSFEERLYKPLLDILPSFQDFCLDTLYLKITIHGYTDPRGLSAGNEHPYRPQSRFKRIYPDENVTIGIDERGNPVTIQKGMDMFRSTWQSDPNNKQSHWIKLPNEGEEGNVLLSKLRAYYTFATFDKKMLEKSPIYAQLRNQGRVILDADGFGIDKQGFKKRNLRDDPDSRRIEIYLDIIRPIDINTHKRLIGGNLKFVQPKTTEILIEDTHHKPKKLLKPDEIGRDDSIISSTPESQTFESAYEAKQTAMLLKPIETKPIESPKFDFDCFSIQYDTYDERNEAESLEKSLNNNGITDTKIIEFFDAFGNKFYRLRSGCYETAQEASDKLNDIIEILRSIGLKRKPMIIR